MTVGIDPRTVAARVRDLPALPQVLVDLMVALQREEIALDDIAMRIGHDQALTAKALRLANCSFYGVPGRVHSIRDAVNVLGIRSLGSALVAAAVSGSFALRDCPGFDLKAYWRHSMACGLCAQAVAEAIDLDPAVAFVAGLLHDIGRLALAAQLPASLGPVFEHRSRFDLPLDQAEQQVLGMDHAEIGAQVARHWHFGAPVVDAIAFHHQPPEATRATMSDVIHVANNIVHALDVSDAPDELVPPLSMRAWERLALTPAQCHAIFGKTEGALDELCDALGI